jgi:hypothetical protein
MGIKAIASRLGVARNTVRSGCAWQRHRATSAMRKGSIVDAVEPSILDLLQDCSDMPATVVAERIGWERSIRVLREWVAELRPLFVPPWPDPRRSVHTSTRDESPLPTMVGEGSAETPYVLSPHRLPGRFQEESAVWV